MHPRGGHLEARLYRSHRTGEIVRPVFTRFSFPPRWHHDVLRTLDYFRASGAPYEVRLEDPLGLLLNRQRRDGRWILQNRYPGRTFFELPHPPGQATRWAIREWRRSCDQGPEIVVATECRVGLWSCEFRSSAQCIRERDQFIPSFA